MPVGHVTLSVWPLLLACAAGLASSSVDERDADGLITTAHPGTPGGAIRVCERAEPKTLNPVFAMDAPSRAVIRRMHADLVSINRHTQKTEAGLARSWTVSRDGRRYVLNLRRDLRFSDGQPFTADDVVFTFQVHLDEKVHSPQRDLLVIGGKPLSVQKIDNFTVAFELAEPYAPGERIFDSIAILPRHLLEPAWKQGTLAQAWTLNTAAAQIAGLGPFRLKQYAPGERIVLERNPWYWKRDRNGTRLPYVDVLEFRFVPTEDAQLLRFMSGETDILNRVGATTFELLRRDPSAQRQQLLDLGPGLEYNFLFFNLGSPGDNPERGRKHAWFGDVRFRRAVSSAIDREGITRLVYNGRATPLWGYVTPGNPAWVNKAIPRPARSLEHSRQLLREAGFSWERDGTLLDARANPVEFSLAVNASNTERVRMATIIQDDLKQLGMRVQVAQLEFRSLIDRVLNTHEYEACIFGLGSGDTDPGSEMNVWLSSGATHIWNPSGQRPATAWEAQIDELMREQLVTLAYQHRKELYDRVQNIVAENMPIIPLASPHILVAARRGVGNFQPAVLDHYTLWNADELYIDTSSAAARSGTP